MKRIAALVLVVALMLPCAVSLAENLCEKEIHFAEFQFGMRYEDVRAQEWVNSIEYRRHILPNFLQKSALFRQFEYILPSRKSP